jgi:phage tail sheath protein FI
MPVTPTYPGVYIEEIPSGVRTIVGVATSITAFIGRALRGLVNEPIRTQSLGEYERTFGGLWSESTMSYAVQHFFLNGGTDAIIVRIVHDDAAVATGNVGGLDLAAANEGTWGNRLKAVVDQDTKDTSDKKLFNLTLQELAGTSPEDDVIASEVFRNISTDATSPRYVKSVLEDQSTFARVGANIPLEFQLAPDQSLESMFTDGNDGGDIVDDDISHDDLIDSRQGLYALDKADIFNLLCIPPLTRTQDVGTDTTIAKAAKYCKDRRALLIVDPRSAWVAISDAEREINNLRTIIGTDLSANAVVYFPRLKIADPRQENRAAEFVPCGAVAGIFARTDAQRGVWKAPAGLEASLGGVRELSYKMTDGENGRLNPLALNSLRTFPVYGHVVWGARTLAGADVLGSEWKYIPVRRLALFIEESLYRGAQWVVFEPNDEPLWAQIRLNIGAFMQNLFRQGAFQGRTPREAYFVKCDKETTTQNDINLGIVNIIVGFAPLKPAEFVIIKIQQMAGQIAA